MTVMHLPMLGILNPKGGEVTDWGNLVFRSRNGVLAFRIWSCWGLYCITGCTG